jgi:hypothetical protein
MAKQQFHATVKSYGGKDPKKKLAYQQKLELARRIESYINERLADEGGPRTFMYYEIAEAIGSTKEGVRGVLFACGGGSGGITL